MVYELHSFKAGGQGMIINKTNIDLMINKTGSQYKLFDWLGNALTTQGALKAKDVIKIFYRDSDLEYEVEFLSKANSLAIDYYNETTPQGMFTAKNDVAIQIHAYDDMYVERPLNGIRFLVYKQLSAIMNHRGMQPEYIIPRIINPLMAHVSFINESGYCHRDIKPDNIMYEIDKQRAVLIDFGLIITKSEMLLPKRYAAGTKYFKSPLHIYFTLPTSAYHELRQQLSWINDHFHRQCCLMKFIKANGYSNMNCTDYCPKLVKDLDMIHEVDCFNYILSNLKVADADIVDTVIKAQDNFTLARSIAWLFPQLNVQLPAELSSKLQIAAEIREFNSDEPSSRHGGSIKATKQLKIKRVIIE
jgi:serine/threonine protein kinase